MTTIMCFYTLMRIIRKLQEFIIEADTFREKQAHLTFAFFIHSIPVTLFDPDVSALKLMMS